MSSRISQGISEKGMIQKYSSCFGFQAQVLMRTSSSLKAWQAHEVNQNQILWITAVQRGMLMSIRYDRKEVLA